MPIYANGIKTDAASAKKPPLKAAFFLEIPKRD
jgi:hypothetical protein